MAAAVAMAAAPHTFAFAAVGTPALNLYKVVFEERFSASRMFGAEAKRLGASVHGLRGEVTDVQYPPQYGPFRAAVIDVTDLWYHDLYYRWRQSPAPIAGLTTYSPLFGLQMMAADVGMRVIYRAHHRPGQGGAITHEVFGPHAAQRHQAELCSSETDWSRTAANIVMAWPADMTAISKAQSNITDADQKAVDPETLISWIIAPRSRGPIVSAGDSSLWR
jgi:hypothetical protein